MKQGIHPTYHASATVTCVCGNAFKTGSTKDGIQTELCHKCHPFFTGTQKIIDSARRVEMFETRQSKKAGTIRNKKKKKVARRTKRAEHKKAETEAIAIEK